MAETPVAGGMQLRAVRYEVTGPPVVADVQANVELHAGAAGVTLHRRRRQSAMRADVEGPEGRRPMNATTEHATSHR